MDVIKAMAQRKCSVSELTNQLKTDHTAASTNSDHHEDLILAHFLLGLNQTNTGGRFFFFFAVVMLKRSNIYIWHVVQISLVLQQNIFDPYGSCITVPPHMVHESVGERKKLWALVIAFNLFLCTMSSSGYFPWSHPWFTLILSQTLSAEACWGVRLTHSLLIKSIAHKQTHMLL